ncbi:MAG TPA: hypothetical protein V6C58_03420 [Allocoleopsis sp.]
MTAILTTITNNIVSITGEPETVSTIIESAVVDTMETVQTISVSTNDTIIIDRGLTSIITSGPIGPPGPQGQPGTPGGEEDMPYAKRVDFVSDTEFYKGEATVGEVTSAASWRIQKTVLGNDGDVTVTWADGNANFDNVWDNRVSLSYS